MSDAGKLWRNKRKWWGSWIVTLERPEHVKSSTLYTIRFEHELHDTCWWWVSIAANKLTNLLSQFAIGLVTRVLGQDVDVVDNKVKKKKMDCSFVFRRVVNKKRLHERPNVFLDTDTLFRVITSWRMRTISLRDRLLPGRCGTIYAYDGLIDGTVQTDLFWRRSSSSSRGIYAWWTQQSCEQIRVLTGSQRRYSSYKLCRKRMTRC